MQKKKKKNPADSVNYQSVICEMYLWDLFKSENTCAFMQKNKQKKTADSVNYQSVICEMYL